MNTSAQSLLALTLIVTTLSGCRPTPATPKQSEPPPTPPKQVLQHQDGTNLNASSEKHDNLSSKEVLLHEGGIDRHWVIKRNGLIVEEHALTIHGDLHVLREYPKGVASPQIDRKEGDRTVESITTVFWPDGNKMSRSTELGTSPNGQCLLWWPNGSLAREVNFALGEPVGVSRCYNLSGQLIGEGKYENGERHSGIFLGEGDSYFLFTSTMLKIQTYKNGVLTKETDFDGTFEAR